jgi:hypothetical protein
LNGQRPTTTALSRPNLCSGFLVGELIHSLSRFRGRARTFDLVVTGPHDISVFFDEVATGFHTREYDYRSVRDLLLRTGFSRVRFPLVFRGFRLATPPYPVLRGIELALQAAPARLRRGRLAGIILGVTALATK